MEEFKNGKIWEEDFYASDYAYAFDVLSKKSCYSCHFKGLNHAADITLGDYWGMDSSMKGYEQPGVSVILCKTEKGKKLVNQISSQEFVMYPADVHHVLTNNPMYCESRMYSNERETFYENIQIHDLHTSVIKTMGKMKYYDKKFNISRKIKKMCRIFGLKRE